MNLPEILSEHRAEIENWLVIGRANWSRLLAKVRDVDYASEGDLYDEQIWTFLLACGYAISVHKGVRALSERCGIDWSSTHRIWFEVLPLPPRPLEGNTNLDLAIGAIARRGETRSGIEFSPNLGSRICFFEFKWYSDISTSTSHDLHRNQLARVIDTAITFSDGHGELPDQAVVALVTPDVFRSRKSASRLYRYKWDEYSSPDALLADLEAFSADTTVDHDYEALIDRLVLKWFSFEELIAGIPMSPYREDFIEFAKAHSPILDI